MIVCVSVDGVSCSNFVVDWNYKLIVLWLDFDNGVGIEVVMNMSVGDGVILFYNCIYFDVDGVGGYIIDF